MSNEQDTCKCGHVFTDQDQHARRATGLCAECTNDRTYLWPAYNDSLKAWRAATGHRMQSRTKSETYILKRIVYWVEANPKAGLPPPSLIRLWRIQEGLAL